VPRVIKKVGAIEILKNRIVAFFLPLFRRWWKEAIKIVDN
jgi:hypothetical protein